MSGWNIIQTDWDEIFDPNTGILYRLLPEEVGVFPTRLIQYKLGQEGIVAEDEKAEALFSLLREDSVKLQRVNRIGKEEENG